MVYPHASKDCRADYLVQRVCCVSSDHPGKGASKCGYIASFFMTMDFHTHTAGMEAYN